MAQMVKKMFVCNAGDSWVQSLGWEDPLEQEIATHSSILAWRIPWTQEPGRLPWGRKQLDTTERLTPTLRGPQAVFVG